MIGVLAQVEDEKERFEKRLDGALGFNMGTWYSTTGEQEQTNVCGTTACLAGHAAVYDGFMFLGSTYCAQPVQGKPGTWENSMDIESAGAEVLELTQEEADTLFYAEDLGAVYEYVADAMGV